MMVPAAEKQLGRDVAPFTRDGGKNHEEGKVGQGTSTLTSSADLLYPVKSV